MSERYSNLVRYRKVSPGDEVVCTTPLGTGHFINGKSYVVDKDLKIRCEFGDLSDNWGSCFEVVKPKKKIENKNTVVTHGTWSPSGTKPKTQYVYEIEFQLDKNGHPDWSTAKVRGK